MGRDRALAAFRFGSSTLAVVALIVVVAESRARGVFDAIDFFSLFTVQSTIIGIVVMIGSAVRCLTRATPSRTWDLVRGAAVVYLMLTLILSVLPLPDVDAGITIPWVALVMHKAFPIVLILDWIIDPPQRLYLQEALGWLVYPLAWTIYSLARGAATGWYPYPFLDPAPGGYAVVAGSVAGILVGGAVLTGVVVILGNALRDRKASTA